MVVVNDTSHLADEFGCVRSSKTRSSTPLMLPAGNAVCNDLSDQERPGTIAL
jgi:hypothetical protein